MIVLRPIVWKATVRSSIIWRRIDRRVIEADVVVYRMPARRMLVPDLMVWKTHSLTLFARGGFAGDCGLDVRWESDCRAASCSAVFLVEPCARPTNSVRPSPFFEFRRTSTVNVLLCSGPASCTRTYDGCGMPNPCKVSCRADL